MSNKSAGNQAEDSAAQYLTENGFKIIDRNWRNRWCEIDIIAKKNSTLYFVEVKSRTSRFQGSGLDYITSKKLKQMSFAASMWVSDNNWTEQYQLSALSVDDGGITFIEHVQV